jgi:cell division protein YceG involved in septum cleavage
MVTTVYPNQFASVRAVQKPTRSTYMVRRVIALFILLSVVFTGALVVGAFQPTTAQSKAVLASKIDSQHVDRIIVEQGVTLWTIATQYKPDSVSTRAYVNYLMKVNQLKSPNLQLGDVVLVP